MKVIYYHNTIIKIINNKFTIDFSSLKKKDDVSTIGSSSTGSPHSHRKSLKNNGSRNQSPRSGLDRGEPRLRPGISGRNSNASSRLSGNMSTLQEDLMKLIDPDYNLDSSIIVSFVNLIYIASIVTL